MDPVMELGWQEARQEIIQELEMIAKSVSMPSASFSDVSDQSLRLYVIKKRVVACPLLSWLQSQPSFQRVYWKRPDIDWACAGVGVSFFEHTKDQDKADIFWERVNAVLAAADVKLFFGMSFSKTMPKGEWKGFYAMQALLPRFCVVEEKGAYYFTCHVLVGPGEKIPFEHIRREIEAVVFPQEREGYLPSVIARKDLPYYDEWNKKVSLAAEAVLSGSVDRIMLSRRSTLELSQSVDPCALLAAIGISRKNGALYLFQFSSDLCLLGASHELLYVRKERNIYSEVTVASRPRGASVIEDGLLERELLAVPKERRDRRYASVALLEAFRTLCLSYDPPSDRKVVRSVYEQYLILTLSGKLQPDVREPDILSAMHPTAFAGGFPVEKALSLIDQWEDVERGWFASPVGMIGRECADLVIAEGSCLVEADRVHLFSGACIERGVSSWHAWEKMDTQIKEILDVFAVGKK